MKLLPDFVSDAFRGIKVGREVRAAGTTSNFANPAPWLFDALSGGPTKSGASVSENTAFNVSVVRACIGFRAWLLATLPIKISQKTARGPVDHPDHPLAKLLRRKVAPGFTRFKWIACSQICYDLGGNAYARIERDRFADVTSIRWTLPGLVTALENRQTGAIGWRIQGESRDRFEHEVLHVANLSTNGRTGRSPLADLREAVGLSLTAEEFSARTFANGNRKPGVLVGAPNYTAEKANAFQEFWMKHYAGAANAGKSPFVWGGVEWKDAGFSSAEAELLGMRRFSVEEIARAYQIPLHLVGSTDKATTWGSGIEQLNQGLVDYMLAPLCANWEAELTTTLLTERELDENYKLKFNVDALLRGSAETRAKVYEKLRGIRAITVNEIRQREDWPEFPDAGANNPEWPLNNQGGGGKADPAKQPATNPDEDVT